MKDLYVINKFVFAEDAKEALELEKDAKVSEVFVESEWRKHKNEALIDAEIYKK